MRNKTFFFTDLFTRQNTTTNLDNFFLDAGLDVEQERFPGSAGEGDLESIFFDSSGDAEPDELLWLLDTVLTGDSSFSDSSEPSDPEAGSLEADLELGAYQFLH